MSWFVLENYSKVEMAEQSVVEVEE